MMDGTIRIRSLVWFATAVVLTLLCAVLVAQAWSVGAAPGDEDSTFVPIAGCRVTDTRAATVVGPRTTPLGESETFTVLIHGENGECTGAMAIPTDAVGVALNVTAANATSRSNIRLFPADLAEVPLLSNLNVSAGSPPTPNKVDVKLSPDGQIKVYNFRGSVNLIIDIVGYFTDSSLKELVDDLAAKADTADVLPRAEIVMSHGAGAFGNPAEAVQVFGQSFSNTTGSGFANMPLTGPGRIGAVDYGVKSIRYCLDVLTGPTNIASVVVSGSTALSTDVVPVVDNTTRTADGCYSVDVNDATSTSFVVAFEFGGGAGSLRIYSVTSTWAPVAELDAPVTASAGGNIANGG